MTTLIIVIVFLVILALSIYTRGNYVVASTGDTYYVLNRKDKQAAAEKLAGLNTTLESIINGMVYRYPSDPAVKRLRRRYRGVLTEREPINPIVGTTYNKGEEIVIAIRRPSGGFISNNRLVYIALHELAHIMTEGYDRHGAEFKENNRKLLNYAIQQRIYRPDRRGV